MDEFDQRQLKIMLNKIHAYEAKNLPLLDLISDLEGLLNLLNFSDLKWKEEFRSNWADLEITYDFALDENKIRLDQKDREVIDEAIKNLKNLIHSKD